MIEVFLNTLVAIIIIAVIFGVVLFLGDWF